DRKHEINSHRVEFAALGTGITDLAEKANQKIDVDRPERLHEEGMAGYLVHVVWGDYPTISVHRHLDAQARSSLANFLYRSLLSFGRLVVGLRFRRLRFRHRARLSISGSHFNNSACSNTLSAHRSSRISTKITMRSNLRWRFNSLLCRGLFYKI